MPEFKIKFRYENGLAEEGLLDLYDSGISLNGISRAITITTHALINGEIRTRGDLAHGASAYLHKFEIVFLNCEPLTSRLRHTNGLAFN